MTDRIQVLTVVLDRDYRTDDVQSIVNAIEMTKGVQSVALGEPVNVNDLVARQRVGMEMYEAINEALRKIIWPERK